jgi:uncharacterized protein (DUF433 family)
MVRELSKHIVADPRVLHGAPSIHGTRIPVAMILEQVAEGCPWDEIVRDWEGKVPREAIAEAVDLARRAFVEQQDATRASA